MRLPWWLPFGNVPVTSLRDRLPGLALSPGWAVVAICLPAHRRPPAVRLLQASGFEARHSGAA